MGSFSIWHWMIVLLIIWLGFWLLGRSRRNWRKSRRTNWREPKVVVEAVIEPTDAPNNPKPPSYYEVDVEPESMTFLVRTSGSQNAKRVAVAAYREVFLSGQGVSHRDASTEWGRAARFQGERGPTARRRSQTHRAFDGNFLARRGISRRRNRVLGFGKGKN